MINYPSTGLSTTKNRIREDRDSLIATIRSVVKTIRLLKKDRNAFMQVLEQESRIKDKEVADAIYKDFIKTMVDNPIPPKAAFFRNIAAAKDAQGVTREVPISEVTDWSLAQDALKGLK